MKVVYQRAARLALGALPKADAERIEAALQQVADAHPQRMPFVTELVGSPGFWRLRKGDWRAIYSITGGVLTVQSIGRRGDIYR